MQRAGCLETALERFLTKSVSKLEGPKEMLIAVGLLCVP